MFLAKAPAWWTEFVTVMNDFLLALYLSLANFGRVEILYLACLLWLVVTWIWVRDTPRMIKFLYFMAYVGLIVSYLMYFVR